MEKKVSALPTVGCGCIIALVTMFFVLSIGTAFLLKAIIGDGIVAAAAAIGFSIGAFGGLASRLARWWAMHRQHAVEVPLSQSDTAEARLRFIVTGIYIVLVSFGTALAPLYSPPNKIKPFQNPVEGAIISVVAVLLGLLLFFRETSWTLRFKLAMHQPPDNSESSGSP